jgi:hypothetical protein
MMRVPHLMAAADAWADIREPVAFVNPWPWLFGLGLLLLLIVLSWPLLRPWRERRRLGPPPVPPAVRARRALAELRLEMALLSTETFTVRVSAILRQYLEDALQLPAPERTTEEFLRELGDRTTLGPELHGALQAFLTRCDLVKFARMPLSPGQTDELLAQATTVIDRTAPEEPAVP